MSGDINDLVANLRSVQEHVVLLSISAKTADCWSESKAASVQICDDSIAPGSSALMTEPDSTTAIANEEASHAHHAQCLTQ